MVGYRWHVWDELESLSVLLWSHCRSRQTSTTPERRNNCTIGGKIERKIDKRRWRWVLRGEGGGLHSQAFTIFFGRKGSNMLFYCHKAHTNCEIVCFSPEWVGQKTNGVQILNSSSQLLCTVLGSVWKRPTTAFWTSLVTPSPYTGQFKSTTICLTVKVNSSKENFLCDVLNISVAGIW